MKVRFGVFEIDEGTGEIRRAGEPVPIQPKPFELLLLLIRERDRVVEFDELMAALWPDSVVSPASLNRAVSHARRAIDDTGRGVVLKSIARRGYRFMGDVVELDDADASTSEGANGSPSERGAGTASDPAALRVLRDGHAVHFVGRVDARERIAAAESVVLEGGSRVVVVSGPPGIGKTRLSEVVADRAQRQGFFCVVGRCRDRDGVPAFWLWSQVLRALVAEPAFDEALRDRIDAGELAALVPAIRDTTPEVLRGLDVDVPASPPGSSEELRFRFFDAAMSALNACARMRPIVLILEDIQWAGHGSLRLLEHIAEELHSTPVLLLTTVRDEARERGHPVDQTVALLRRQPHADSIELSGLSRGEVGELLRGAMGGERPAPVDLVSELYARTEGVPFFVGEAIRLLEERGDLARPERIPRHGVTLPTRAIDLIRRSIDGISNECLSLLSAGSVLGRSFKLRAAVSIGAFDPETSLDLIDEAVRSGIVEESDEGAGSYRFVHALFQEAIYEGISSGQRARLHREAGRLLEAQNEGTLAPVLSELAHHHHAAIAVGDPERAFDVAIRAAQQAEELVAWEQAAMHYEQAVACFDQLEGGDPAKYVETLLSLGEAHRLSGDRERRIQAFDRGVRVARDLEADSQFTRAAIGLCDVSEWSSRVPDHAGDVLEEALARAGDDDLVSQSRVATRLAYLCVREPRRAEPMARRGVQLARKSGEPVALQESLYVLQYVLSGPDHLVERADLIDELAEAARACANRDTAVIALLDVAADGLQEGDSEKAVHYDRLAKEVGGAHPSPTTRWHRNVWDAGLALMRGHLAEADQGIHDALLLGKRIAHPFAGACYSGQVSLLDRERGEHRRIVDRLEKTLSHTGVGATQWTTAVVGRAARAIGDDRLASRMLESIAGTGFENIARTVRWNGSVAEASLLAADLDSDAHASALLDLLSTAPQQHGLLPMVVSYSGPLARPRARLSATLGRADEAIGFFDEALEEAESIGARPCLAKLGVEMAPVLRRTGDSARADELLDQSESLAREIGMPHVEEAARSAHER